MWSGLWLCPDWTVSSTATLANVPLSSPVFVRAGGRGENHRKKRSPLHIAGRWYSVNGGNLCFCPGLHFAPSLSHSRGEVTAGFLFQTLFLSLLLDCCSFSPFLFFFDSPCNVRPPAALCMSQASTRASVFLCIYISRRLKHKENVYIYIRNPQRWIPHPPVRRVWQMERNQRNGKSRKIRGKKGPERTIIEFIQLTSRCLPLSSSQYLGVMSTSTHFR